MTAVVVCFFIYLFIFGFTWLFFLLLALLLPLSLLFLLSEVVVVFLIAPCCFWLFVAPVRCCQENMLENGGEPKTIDMIDQVIYVA